MTEHVLVVDEQSDSRELVAEFLAGFGYQATKAISIAEAQRVRRSAAVDLVLLDARVACRDRRARASTSALIDSGVPLVLMTQADEAVPGRAFAGVCAYLARPVGLQPLLSTVRRVLRSRSEPVAGVAGNVHPHRPGGHALAENVAAQLFSLPLHDARIAFERYYFEHQLQQTHKGVAGLSTRVGLERTHLYRKLRQLGIAPWKHEPDSSATA